MKELLKKTGMHQFAPSIALTIALGIMVQEIFLIVAQVVAVAACVYLMIMTMQARRTRKENAH